MPVNFTFACLCREAFDNSVSLSLEAECRSQMHKVSKQSNCNCDRQVTTEMIDDAEGYRDGRIGCILSAVELKHGAQEMKTAVTRKFHLPLSPLHRFYLSLFSLHFLLI